MSFRHRWRQGKNRPQAAKLRLVGPRRWSLWQVSRGFLAYVLAVDTAAIAAVVATAHMAPTGRRELAWFGVLAGCSVLHLEVTRSWERLRELHTQGRAYTDFQSVWTVAGLLVLPPLLVAALIGLTYTHM